MTRSQPPPSLATRGTPRLARILTETQFTALGKIEATLGQKQLAWELIGLGLISRADWRGDLTCYHSNIFYTTQFKITHEQAQEFDRVIRASEPVLRRIFDMRMRPDSASLTAAIESQTRSETEFRRQQVLPLLARDQRQRLDPFAEELLLTRQAADLGLIHRQDPIDGEDLSH